MKRGFTLTEVLIAAAISSILAGVTAVSYVNIQRIVARGQDDLLVAQTGRVVIDRISRDVRQAIVLVQSIPADKDDGLTSLEFEDGHSVDPAGPVYISYTLTGNTVRRSRHYYYNVSDPTKYLTYNAGTVGTGGFAVADIANESYIIADDVADLKMYGTKELIQIDVAVKVGKTGKTTDFHSAVAKRN